MTSYIMTEHLRSVAKERIARRFGSVSPDTLATVEERVRILLGR